MPRQYWPAVTGLAVFALSAVAVAAFMVASGRLDPYLASGGLLLLAAGQIGFIIAAIMKVSRLEDWLSHHQGLLAALSSRIDGTDGRIDSADSRIEAVESKLDQPPDSRLGEIISDMRALRESIRNIAAPKPAPAPVIEPVPAPPEPAPLPRPANERLELLLEPVIELASGSTAHYRVLLDLTDDNGHVVRHHELMHKANQGGMRPALDAHMVRQVAPVLRRLRQRNPGLRAFVPIGTATLNSRQESGRLLSIVETEADVAAGLVFEFHHDGLARLDDTGIAALAKLGRLGATMALSDVQMAGLDLAALRQLGVRFLTLSAAVSEPGVASSPAWREFVQYARAMQFQIVMSGIETPLQATAATQIGRYGFGGFFAPPRKVRANAGSSAVPRRGEAA